MNLDFWLYKIYVQITGDLTAQAGRSADFWAAKLYYAVALGDNNNPPVGRGSEFYLGKFYFYLTSNSATIPYLRSNSDWLRLIYYRMRYGVNSPVINYGTGLNEELWARQLYDLVLSGQYVLRNPRITNTVPLTVLDEATNGTVVGTVVGIDADYGNSLTYAIVSGNTGNTFALNTNTGVLTVAVAIDYLVTSTYSLIIRVTDNSGLTGTGTITVNVTSTINTYVRYIATINPLLWMRNRETSGVVAANAGSSGSALNGTIGGTTTLAQTGKLGANEAFLFDGATSFIQVPNNAAINALSLFSFVALVKPSSRGEGNSGTFFRFGNGTTLLSYSSNRLFVRVDYVTTDALTQTSVGDEPTLNAWQLIFLTLDTDKKLRLYRGINSTVTEYTYSTQTAGVGARVTEVADLIIGNSQNQTSTFAGLQDEILLPNFVLSAAQMLQIVKITGV